MAYTDFGQLMPSEAGFKTPGMYGAYLQAEGAKKATYLSDMDQFFANLAETTRRFNEDLGFKNRELASRETLTREEYGLRRELQDEQLEYNRWMIGQQTKSAEKIAGMKNQRENYLGGPSAREIYDAEMKNRRPTRGGTMQPEGSNIRVWEQGKNPRYTLSPEDEALARTRAGISMTKDYGEGWGQYSPDYSSNYGQGGSGSGVANYTEYKDNWENT